MNDESLRRLFLVSVLIVFFLLLYVYAAPKFFSSSSSHKIVVQEKHMETFKQFEEDNKLLSPYKVVYIQGNGIPDQEIKPIQFDQGDPAATSVDGTPDAPKSLFPFAFNKCDVSCCDDSAFSCNGGCVCLTPEQKKMFGGARCGKR